MSSDFIGKIEKFIEENHMLELGDSVVAGVSGGADSVALLFVLHELAPKYNLRLTVAHVNHGLRPEAAEEAEFVRNLCADLKVPVFFKSADVTALSEESGKGTEETGRDLRYAFFRELAGDKAKIAVAHNMNDLSETMIFHLCRGTGPRGLASIPPVRDRLIRPLLCVKRKEIEAFLKERGVKYCTDRSNFSDEYTRNRIRNGIIPALEKDVSTEAVEHMYETSELLRKITNFADVTAAEAFERVSVPGKEGTVSFSADLLLKEHEYIQSLLVKEAIDRLAPGNRDITAAHIESALSLLETGVGKRVNLPYSIEVKRGYLDISFSRNAEKEGESPEASADAIRVDIEGETTVPGLGRVVCKIVPAKTIGGIIRKEYTKYLDYDKITESLVVRKRCTGDRICINRNGGSKKLKDFFIDLKIDREDRDGIFLFADGSEVVWIPGIRLSEAYKVTDETVNVLIVDLHKEGIC